MRDFALALALAVLPLPAIAQPAGPVSAVLAEKASGFKNLAECEKILGRPDSRRQKTLGNKRSVLRGSLFNRAAGNISRCEMIDGEPLIVVIPKGS
jgi:hypothetical protein